MKPCKHLDYDESMYLTCRLETLAPHYPDVRYWRRDEAAIDNGPGQPRGPERVQFCRLRGRINGIFQCYNPGEMSCYETEE